MTVFYRPCDDYILFYTNAEKMQFNKKGFEYPKAIQALKKHFNTQDIRLQDERRVLIDFEVFYENEV
jgi:hypothetical protein